MILFLSCHFIYFSVSSMLKTFSPFSIQFRRFPQHSTSLCSKPKLLLIANHETVVQFSYLILMLLLPFVINLIFLLSNSLNKSIMIALDLSIVSFCCLYILFYFSYEKTREMLVVEILALIITTKNISLPGMVLISYVSWCNGCWYCHPGFSLFNWQLHDKTNCNFTSCSWGEVANFHLENIRPMKCYIKKIIIIFAFQ